MAIEQTTVSYNGHCPQIIAAAIIIKEKQLTPKAATLVIDQWPFIRQGMFINLLEATVISLSTLACDHRADLSNVSC